MVVQRGVWGGVLLAGAVLAGAQAAGGAKPRIYVSAAGSQLAVEQAFLASCPQARVTEDVKQAAFVFHLRHQGKPLLARRDQWAPLLPGGDVVAAGAVRSVGHAVKDACAALGRHEASAAAANRL